MRKYLILIFMSMFSVAQGQSKAMEFKGKVVNETGQALIGATVQLINLESENAGDTTDEEGLFSIPMEKQDEFTLRVSYVGYTDVEVQILGSYFDKNAPLQIVLTEREINISTVDVRVGRYHDQDFLPSLVETITIEEVRKFPATFFDPARLAQSFAGVANTNDQANGLSIRGSSPDFFKWFLEGVEIVNPNHTSNAGTVNDRATQNAGGVNILSAQLLSQSHFYKSAYPVQFQNALSGIMSMSLRNGDNQACKHFVQLGLIGLEASSEGPINKNNKKGSYLFNYRYSTVGLLSNLGLDFGGETIAFQDAAFNVSLPVERGIVKIFGVAGLSENRFSAPDDIAEVKEEKDNFDIDFVGKMGLMGFNYDTNLGNNSRLNITSVLSGNDENRSSKSARGISELNIEDADRNILWSNKIICDQKKNYTTWSYGLHHNTAAYKIETLTSDASTLVAGEGLRHRVGGSVNMDYMLSPSWQILLGVQTNYLFSNDGGDSEWLVEPRMHVQYRSKKNKQWDFSTGLYSQQNTPRTLRSSISSFSNIGLKSIKSWQNIISFQQNYEQYNFKIEAYFQYLYKVPVSINSVDYSILNGSEDARLFPLANLGKGKNYGVEFSVRKSSERGFFWMANATLYQAEYWTPGLGWELGRYSGGYIFNAMIGKEWVKENKTHGINLRGNVLGGFRYLSINEFSSASANTTIYNRGLGYLERLRPYHRIDMRIFRTVKHKKFTSTISLDVQNLTNVKNAAFSTYDNVLGAVVEKKQLGLIPILNYRIQF